MNKILTLLSGAAFLALGTQAHAQDALKIALVEMLSGPNAATGRSMSAPPNMRSTS